MTHSLNAYELSRLADCGEPDKPDSLGAQFLLGVQDAVNEALTPGNVYEEGNDAAHEIADNAVPVYTYIKWQTFVDLCAWQEDLDDWIGSGTKDIDDLSNIALYIIAERLAMLLFEEASQPDVESETDVDGLALILFEEASEEDEDSDVADDTEENEES